VRRVQKTIILKNVRWVHACILLWGALANIGCRYVKGDDDIDPPPTIPASYGYKVPPKPELSYKPRGKDWKASGTFTIRVYTFTARVYIHITCLHIRITCLHIRITCLHIHSTCLHIRITCLHIRITCLSSLYCELICLICVLPVVPLLEADLRHSYSSTYVTRTL
jgi:hypothetical protein